MKSAARPPAGLSNTGRFIALLILASGLAFAVGTRSLSLRSAPTRSVQTHPVTGRVVPGMATNGAWMDRRERSIEEEPDRALALIGIEPGMTVADIGAGTGYMTARLASLVGASGHVFANEIQPAMEAIMKRIGFGSSDYGKSFADFEENWMQHITQRSTVIILGDARNNNLDPRVDILRRISERSKRIIWLNPESRFAWGTGDSEMPRYEPFCKLARPCGTVQQLERVVSDLMAMDRH